MEKYVAPEFYKNAFTCIHCGVLAQMSWDILKRTGLNTNYQLCKCNVCNGESIWLTSETVTPSGNSATIGNLVYPDTPGFPLPSSDMPEDIQTDYMEARNIANRSPRGAAALLRLALQKLCEELGYDQNLNQAIGQMVDAGLPKKVQQLWDIIRIAGNESVHPGTIDLNEDPKMVSSLFKFINLIVEKMITEPKEIDELYSSLPEDKLKSIEKRDGGN